MPFSSSSSAWQHGERLAAEGRFEALLSFGRDLGDREPGPEFVAIAEAVLGFSSWEVAAAVGRGMRSPVLAVYRLEQAMRAYEQLEIQRARQLSASIVALPDSAWPFGMVAVRTARGLAHVMLRDLVNAAREVEAMRASSVGAHPVAMVLSGSVTLAGHLSAGDKSVLRGVQDTLLDVRLGLGLMPPAWRARVDEGLVRYAANVAAMLTLAFPELVELRHRLERDAVWVLEDQAVWRGRSVRGFLTSAELMALLRARLEGRPLSSTERGRLRRYHEKLGRLGHPRVVLPVLFEWLFMGL